MTTDQSPENYLRLYRDVLPEARSLPSLIFILDFKG
jgi:hypothetical protein